MKGGRRPFPAFCALLLTVSILAGSTDLSQIVQASQGPAWNLFTAISRS